MLKFEIFGVKFKISFLFVCFIAWMLLNNQYNITQIYISSALLHECLHILTLTAFSSSLKEIKLELCGVTIKTYKKLPNLEELIVLASGCFGNFALFLLFTTLKLKTAAAVNLIIFVFNILPHEKLDGGQILSKILSLFVSSYVSFKIIRVTTTLTTIAIVSTAIFATIYFKNFAFLLGFIFFTLSFMLNA